MALLIDKDIIIKDIKKAITENKILQTRFRQFDNFLQHRIDILHTNAG